MAPLAAVDAASCWIGGTSRRSELAAACYAAMGCLSLQGCVWVRRGFVTSWSAHFPVMTRSRLGFRVRGNVRVRV